MENAPSKLVIVLVQVAKTENPTHNNIGKGKSRRELILTIVVVETTTKKTHQKLFHFALFIRRLI